jgi:Ca2+-transporting ATPase
MQKTDKSLFGLTSEEVLENRKRFGSNSLILHSQRPLLRMLVDVVKEPVFLLLVFTCALYFAIGDSSEAWLTVAAVVFVALIEIVQEFRSEKALAALREMTQPRITVIREGKRLEISSEELVVHDLMCFSEGERIPADGHVKRQNDLSIDEAILTGESLPVGKRAAEGEGKVFQGTIVVAGAGIAEVTSVGMETEFGKLGKSIESIEKTPTPLQMQIDRFVRQLLWVGLLAFIVVFSLNYYYTSGFLTALLFSLAFAIALVPEEIPVAFTTFMALGAYRMTRHHVLVKQPKTVESLGAATVICLDKTGTITENKMSVAEAFDFSGKKRVLEYAMWASEPHPFDPMEKAIHIAYTKETAKDFRPGTHMVHEYPLSGVPPMMTHVYQQKNQSKNGHIVAAKGAVERIVRVCKVEALQESLILEKTKEMASKGYRVLGVCSAEHTGDNYPKSQDAFSWHFEGLLAMYDPPKKGIAKVMEHFYGAGLDLKMITGDYAETAMNIAQESGIRIKGEVLTGEAVLQMKQPELQEAVKNCSVFARMFPEAKLRVVEALKANGEVVAMTGDGVNDGPALKSAQVGIAMGRRGTEIAKGAASMVLLDDDLSHMLDAIKTGRRIYQNLRKAIRYIISIHLPIVLTVLLPLVFGWPYLHMLMPIHVIFLELIMDPTCAVAFENEPAEPNVLQKPPHVRTGGLFTGPELLLSVLQGAMITAGILAMYYYAVLMGKDEATTRSFVFVTLLSSNILLTLANRSFEYTLATTLFYRNRLLWGITGIATAILLGIVLFPFMRGLFHMGPISMADAGWCLLTAGISVGWFEVWKWAKMALRGI